MTGKKNNITISDLAKAIGTSSSTISRALNNHPKISSATKKKVKEVAFNMGYINSIQAAIKHNFNNNTIGIIVPTLAQSKYNIMLESARKILENEGYNVIISCSSESTEQEQSIVRLFESLNVQGVIASLTYKDKKPAYFRAISEYKPLVLFDRISFELPCNKVMIDHFQAGFRAVQHLLNNGCKRIAHLGGNINCPLSRQIATGYKTAIKNGGLKANPKLEIFSDYLLEDVTEAIDIIFSQKEKPDAILIDDILAAQKLTSILQTKKIRIPEDIAILAIADEEDYSYFSPSLTTIQLPYSKIGVSAATILIEQLQKKNSSQKNKTIIEPFNLNIQNSTLRS